MSDSQKQNLKHRLPKIQTLAMLKMEKNFIALEKGYPRQPYVDPQQPVGFLIGRIKDELVELEEAYKEFDVMVMQEECADISNIIDYLFERLSRMRDRK